MTVWSDCCCPLVDIHVHINYASLLGDINFYLICSVQGKKNKTTLLNCSLIGHYLIMYLCGIITVQQDSN